MCPYARVVSWGEMRWCMVISNIFDIFWAFFVISFFYIYGLSGVFICWDYFWDDKYLKSINKWYTVNIYYNERMITRNPCKLTVSKWKRFGKMVQNLDTREGPRNGHMGNRLRNTQGLINGHPGKGINGSTGNRFRQWYDGNDMLLNRGT